MTLVDKAMTEATHLTLTELESARKTIRETPRDNGNLLMIVRRPATDQREVVNTAQLDCVEGLIGDDWKTRGSKATGDSSAHPEKQLSLISARLIAHIAQAQERWPLAGD